MLRAGGEGAEGAGAVAGVGAGDIVEFVQSLCQAAEGEVGSRLGNRGECGWRVPEGG